MTRVSLSLSLSPPCRCTNASFVAGIKVSRDEEMVRGGRGVYANSVQVCAASCIRNRTTTTATTTEVRFTRV